MNRVQTIWILPRYVTILNSPMWFFLPIASPVVKSRKYWNTFLEFILAYWVRTKIQNLKKLIFLFLHYCKIIFHGQIFKFYIFFPRNFWVLRNKIKKICIHYSWCKINSKLMFHDQKSYGGLNCTDNNILLYINDFID